MIVAIHDIKLQSILEEDKIVDLLQDLLPDNKKRKAKLLNTTVDTDFLISEPVLHGAVRHDMLNIVNLLLDEGAGKCVKFLMLNIHQLVYNKDPNIKNNYGDTTLHLACCSVFYICSEEDITKLVKLLVER